MLRVFFVRQGARGGGHQSTNIVVGTLSANCRLTSVSFILKDRTTALVYFSKLLLCFRWNCKVS